MIDKLFDGILIGFIAFCFIGAILMILQTINGDSRLMELIVLAFTGAVSTVFYIKLKSMAHNK